jgi:ribosome biogenesis GTPase A
MNKAKKKISESLKLIDLAIELRDARIPSSSANPDIESILKDKLRIILLNKKDFADQDKTLKWIEFMALKGVNVDAISCMDNADIVRVKSQISKICKKRRQEIKAKLGIEKTIRLIVIGIPNVGKSTLINRLSGEKKTKTEDKPGITRGNQWIRIDNFTEILDTPGILWPNLGDQATALHLAYTGSIKQDTLDSVYIANKFLEEIMSLYPDVVIRRYGLDGTNTDTEALLGKICIRLGLLKPGGLPDLETVSIRLMRDFQTGKLGRITLETPLI